MFSCIEAMEGSAPPPLRRARDHRVPRPVMMIRTVMISSISIDININTSISICYFECDYYY